MVKAPNGELLFVSKVILSFARHLIESKKRKTGAKILKDVSSQDNTSLIKIPIKTHLNSL
jgi:hypothetical protein